MHECWQTRHFCCQLSVRTICGKRNGRQTFPPFVRAQGIAEAGMRRRREEIFLTRPQYVEMPWTRSALPIAHMCWIPRPWSEAEA